MAGLFGKPKMPAIEPPKPMPDADDPQITQARRRRVAKETQQSGVRSTLLSTGGRETLGG